MKPRASFWKELTLFMNSYNDLYRGDGRSLQEIGLALGFNEFMAQQVQQEADKPDKVAMNIWRKLCSTQEYRVFVGSIKNVPLSTLQNIHSKCVVLKYIK